MIESIIGMSFGIFIISLMTVSIVLSAYRMVPMAFGWLAYPFVIAMMPLMWVDGIRTARLNRKRRNEWLLSDEKREMDEYAALIRATIAERVKERRNG